MVQFKHAKRCSNKVVDWMYTFCHVAQLILQSISNVLNFINYVYSSAWAQTIKTQRHCLRFWQQSFSAWLYIRDVSWTNEGNPVCGLFWTRTWKHKQTDDVTGPHMSYAFAEEELASVTWKQGWCRCCPAAAAQVCASRGRRMEEGSPFDTGTASAVCPDPLGPPPTASVHGFPLSCLGGRVQLLLALRMWNETGSAPAERPVSHLPLNNKKESFHSIVLCL